MSIINELYEDAKYFKACQKIAGPNADDLHQHVNIMFYELEQAGKLNLKSKNCLYSYYRTTAKREYYNKHSPFNRLHRERFQTIEHESKHDEADDSTQTANDLLFLCRLF